MTKELVEIRDRLTRIETRIEWQGKILESLASIPINIENAKTRIEALEECNRDGKRNRWRFITAIVAAVLTSLATMVTVWFKV